MCFRNPSIAGQFAFAEDYSLHRFRNKFIAVLGIYKFSSIGLRTCCLQAILVIGLD